MERKKWIDLARGLCMMTILYDHTEIYYTGDNIIPYHLYVTNALIAFYFISGYLFYKESTFHYQRKMKSILRTIIIPYFIFTCLIALPKAWVHGNDIHLSDIVKGIVLGQASWFVAALIVAELMFSTLIYICKGKIVYLSAFSIGCLVLSMILSFHQASYPWQISNALQAVFIIYLGYLYHMFEKTIYHVYSQRMMLLSFLLFVFIKIYESYKGMNLYINPIVIDNYVVFILDVCLFNILLIHLCKYLEKNIYDQSHLLKMISWTGAHSLIYYFLCGGVPLLVSMAMKKIIYAYEGQYVYVIIAFISVYFITSVITWMIYRYIPQITGKR